MPTEREMLTTLWISATETLNELSQLIDKLDGFEEDVCKLVTRLRNTVSSTQNILILAQQDNAEAYSALNTEPITFPSTKNEGAE